MFNASNVQTISRINSTGEVCNTVSCVVNSQKYYANYTNIHDSFDVLLSDRMSYDTVVFSMHYRQSTSETVDFSDIETQFVDKLLAFLSAQNAELEHYRSQPREFNEED